MSDEISNFETKRFQPEYHDRIILTNPFNKSEHLSYGLIAYCIKTNKWLLTRRKHSSEFLFILRGMFTIAQFYDLSKKLTLEEFNIITDIVTGKNTISKVYFQVFNTHPKNISYIRKRLNHSRLKEILLKIGSSNGQLEWSWPKGKPNDKYEKPINAAIREFQEETGLILKNEPVLTTRYFTYSIINKISNTVYKTNCYLCLFSEERLPNPNIMMSQNETSSVQWMSTTEIQSLVIPVKFRALQESQKFLTQNFYPKK